MILRFNFVTDKGSFGLHNSLVLPFIALFLFFSIDIQSQVVFYSEGFETDGEGVRYTSNTYDIPSPTCDFFARMPSTPLNVCFQNNFFTGFQGSYFWGSEDIMSSPGTKPPGSIVSQSINTSGYTNLTISLYLATGNNIVPTNSRWESADSINIQVSFNGGSTYTTVGRFVGNNIVGGDLIKDVNLNGVADTGEPVASVNTFTKHTFNISGTGSSMIFRLDFDQLGGSEELGIDQIEIAGIAAPCPTFSGAPANVTINNSTCASACTVSGGSFTIPSGTPCPTGSTLQYSVNGGAFTSTPPTYNQTGPIQSIVTRCTCDANPATFSTSSSAVVTVPGSCTTPSAPAGSLAIVNSTCTGCVLSGGSIAIGTVTGSGGTLEYTTNGGMTWSTSIPTYQPTPLNIGASVLAANGCRSNIASVGSTIPSTCTIPSPPTGSLSITNSTCVNCIAMPGSIAIGSVSGSGGTLEYSPNGGMTWSSALPVYDNNNALTIQASVLSSNGCRSSITTVGTTNPGFCITVGPPMGSLAITNSTCVNCVLSGGSIGIGTVSGSGGTLEFSIDNGMTWSAMLPVYDMNNALTIQASMLSPTGCRSTATLVGTTNPGVCVAAVTIGSNCYTNIENALAAAMPGQVIEVHVNLSSLGNNVIPQGITVQINPGACWNNATTLTNNGTIQLVGTGKLINQVNGIYQGIGNIDGNLINDGTVKPGN